MQALVERIRSQARHLGNGLIGVDSFINHQVDPSLTTEMGQALAQAFGQAKVSDITRIVTAEVSGLPIAFATAQAMGLPMVFARKHRPKTMPDHHFTAHTRSYTHGQTVTLRIAAPYLQADDRVLIIDDFLATGDTIFALAELVQRSGATLCGIGCAIEKPFEHGRDRLRELHVPILSLARVELIDQQLHVSD
ncbi:xanthine phosphoribosyltransferase [Candidatus Entotheonella serta]|nr:xanthine phosphoribosyltransferase [Candidatus Entotheonella serta]